MLDQEILDNLKNIEFTVKTIKDLHKYQNLDIISLKQYGKILNSLVKELNENIKRFY